MGPHHWWAFALATATILVALRLVLGPQWASDAGLNLSPAQAFWVIVAFVVVAAASATLLQHVYQTAGLTVTAPAIEDQAGFLFQALNEEILFRALLIGLIVAAVRPPSLLAWILISLGLALAFPAAHFLLYRYSNPMHLALPLPALATLFCAGLAMNNLYLAFRHIGFSWGLHAGWNVVWLPATFYDAASHARLAEPQIFERVLGSAVVAASACMMAAVSFVFLLRRSVSPK
jgi:hypothetical protein